MINHLSLAEDVHVPLTEIYPRVGDAGTAARLLAMPTGRPSLLPLALVLAERRHAQKPQVGPQLRLPRGPEGRGRRG